MNQFAWQQRYESGIEQLDLQHKTLFRKILTCISASRDGATHLELYAKLQDILRFIKQHFSEEEKLMNDGDQTSKVHKHQHAWLANKLEYEISRFGDKSPDRMTAQGILIYLHDWYVEHIEFEDKLLQS